jgi:cytochrome c553
MQGANRGGAVRMGRVLVAALPFVLAALIIKRPELAPSACPAAGEGRTMCLLEQSWSPWLTAVSAAAVGMHALAWLFYAGIPDVVRRFHRGDRLRFGKPPSRRAWQADARLAAAVWAPATEGTPRAHRLAEGALSGAQQSDGLAVCGRCHQSHAITGFRAICPDCGGMAVRAIVAPRLPGEARAPIGVR